MDYRMEELVPVVAELVEKYTSAESTSVTYERAAHLMEAVLYCIHECEGQAVLMAADGLSAKEAYSVGKQLVKEKTACAQRQYERLMEDFCAYENENYHDTVVHAVPGFFRKYDIEFAPQETIITMDYPVLMPPAGLTGIDAIAEYIRCIALEQQFMGTFPGEYVIEVLHGYQAGYRRQFYNLCSILFRHTLERLLASHMGDTDCTCSTAQVRERLVRNYTRQQMQELLEALTEQMVLQGFQNAGGLAAYLKCDIDDYITGLLLEAGML